MAPAELAAPPAVDVPAGAVSGCRGEPPAGGGLSWLAAGAVSVKALVKHPATHDRCAGGATSLEASAVPPETAFVERPLPKAWA